MTEDQKVSAQLARDAADAVARLAESDPDFASDEESWVTYEDALTSLASAYYRTTHSGIGLVSGELLAAALPALAMRYWDAASELTRVGAAYAEVEVAHIEKGGHMYDYATVPYTLASISPVNWYAPDLAEDVLPGLIEDAKSIAATSRRQWLATRNTPVEDWPDDPDREGMLQQLSDGCATLDAAGSFPHGNRPPLVVLLGATVISIAQRSWSTAYPFAAATAVLAEYELHHLEPAPTAIAESIDFHGGDFTPEERARRKAIVMAMLEERDRLGSMSLEEVLRARDEGRA